MTNNVSNETKWQQQINKIEGLMAAMQNTAIDDTQGDIAAEQYADARDTLLATQAPDFEALKWKMKTLETMSDDGSINTEDFQNIMADLKRLTA